MSQIRGVKRYNTWAGSKKDSGTLGHKETKEEEIIQIMSTNTNAATYEVLYARKVSWQLVISDVSIFLNLGQII